MRGKQHRRRPEDKSDKDEPKKFGDLVAMDHIDLRGQKSVNGSSLILCIRDKAFGFGYAFPADTKEAEECHKLFDRFMGQLRPKRVYTDRAKEFMSFLSERKLVHDTSAPGCHRANGYIERYNRSLEETARALLVQAGLPPTFSEYAVPYASLALNLVDEGEDGRPWLQRFGKEFPAVHVPFGARVAFLAPPTSSEGIKQQKLEPSGMNGGLLRV